MTTNRSGKRGIALIIVLGLLALLMMTGVAFSVFMRTERHAAGSFLHDIKARLLLQTASVRAMEALDQEMAANYYPSWLVLNSVGGKEQIPLSTNQPWARHVPDFFLTDTEMANAITNVNWLSTPNGRLAFLILNASGFVDVNTAGGGARSYGSDTAEIQLTQFPEVVDLARLTSKTYESVAEMKRAGASVGLNGVSYLQTYSRFPTNRMPQLFDLGADLLDNAQNWLPGKRDEIKTILQTKKTGSILNEFPDINADQVVDALKDYIDSDNVPTKLDSPCTERVPMINEIAVCPRVMPDGRYNFTIAVELNYPFLNTRKPAETFDLRYRLSIVTTNVLAPLVPAGFPAPGTLQGTVAPTPWNGAEFTRVSIPCPLSVDPVTNQWANQTAFFHVRIDSLDVIDSKSSRVVDSVSNIVVTPAVGGAVDTNYIPFITVPIGNLAPFFGHSAGVECVDPRFNYLSQVFPPVLEGNAAWWTYPRINSRTGSAWKKDGTTFPAAVNDSTTWVLQNRSNDRHQYLHVADAPIRSVGELSYLPRGIYSANISSLSFWKTLRLVDEMTGAHDPFYTYFTVDPPSSPLRGYVNPNTDVPKVLESVFVDMPIDCYPGETNDYPGYRSNIQISKTDAATLAAAWMDDPTWTAGYSSKGQLLSNVTYLNAVSNIMNNMNLSAIPANQARRNAWQFRKEAGFRNLMGLLNPRQNYFIIILFAQSSSQVVLPGGATTNTTVRASQFGVMEVWGDPQKLVVTNAPNNVTTTYPKFVRRFEILTEE